MTHLLKLHQHLPPLSLSSSHPTSIIFLSPHLTNKQLPFSLLTPPNIHNLSHLTNNHPPFSLLTQHSQSFSLLTHRCHLSFSQPQQPPPPTDTPVTNLRLLLHQASSLHSIDSLLMYGVRFSRIGVRFSRIGVRFRGFWAWFFLGMNSDRSLGFSVLLRIWMDLWVIAWNSNRFLWWFGQFYCLIMAVYCHGEGGCCGGEGGCGWVRWCWFGYDSVVG